MASGNYSRNVLTNASYTTIASGPAVGFVQVVTVSFCNTSASQVPVRLAIATTGTTTPAATDWIEYDTYIDGGEALERTGIVLGNGQILLAYAGTASVVSCSVYGVEGTGVAASGILGRVNLGATTWASLVSAPSAGRIKTCTVNICNRNSSAITVRLALAATPTSPAAADYLEYNFTIPAAGVLERSGIVIDSGEGIGVYSSTANVTAVAYGIDDTDT